MYHILIADDEPIERMLIRKIIEDNFEEKLEIVEASNGREAINKFFEKRCDIILLDIEMPGITGLQAAEIIRNEDNKCSIIFLTAFDYFIYAKKAIEIKALDYLLKPSCDEEVVAVIQEAIRIAGEKQDNVENVKETRDKNIKIILDDTAENRKMSVVKELILNFITDHYPEDISLQDVARAINYSDAYFCKIFKQLFNKGFITYLSEFRIDKSKQLLKDIRINVKDISERVGYRDSNYFAKVFKRIQGITPSEYRSLVLEEKMTLLDKVD